MNCEYSIFFLIFRGVVQLFNAVRTHQKTVDNSVKESGSSERKKAKLLSSVSKKDFIDVLRRTEGGSKGSVNNVKSTVSPLMALCCRSFFYHSTKYLEVHRLHCIHIFFFLSFLHVYSHLCVTVHKIHGWVHVTVSWWQCLVKKITSCYVNRKIETFDTIVMSIKLPFLSPWAPGLEVQSSDDGLSNF